MPVSRGRKTKKQSQLPTPPPTNEWIVRWLKWPRLLVTVFTTIGTILAFVLGIIAEPQLDVDSGGMTNPFAVPIKVTNRSWLLAMDRTELSCGVKDLRLTGGLHVRDLAFVFAGQSQRIGRLDDRNFQCRIVSIQAAGLVKAEVDVRVNFQNFGVTRTSKPMRITWFTAATPPRWVKGEFSGSPMQ